MWHQIQWFNSTRRYQKLQVNTAREPVMDFEAEKASIDRIRRVQRNWDTSVQIPENLIDHWIYLATNAPSKQDEAYFNIYVITDRAILDTLIEHSYGFHVPVVPEQDLWGVLRNPQMCASAYFLFALKKPNTNRNRNADGTLRQDDYAGRRDNALVAMGIAMGIVAFSAAGLGYHTGFNKNHGDSESKKVWEQLCKVDPQDTICMGLGIGMPVQGRERNWSPETKILVGYPRREYDTEVHDQIEHEGQSYPMPKLQFRTYSDLGPKDIKVYRI